MSPVPVLAVIFDYGGVLYPEGPDDFDALGRRWGLAPGRLWAAYHDLPEYGPSRRGEIDAAAYLEGVVRFLAAELGDAKARSLVDEFEAMRRRQEVPPVAPEVDALLDRLRGRVRLGLLTNGTNRSRAILDARDIPRRFDDVVCSGEVGVAKPDPAVFRLAAARLGLEPEACAFVDDMERNVLAARSVGMRAHQHHRSRMGDLVGFLAAVGALGDD